ncbi:MAG: hypothetical protein M3T56_13200 [Chloroflexota bacterium]|nr:hypothetical protein [Chloroflexota bacterium]
MVFVGRDSDVNYGFANWLAARHELLAYFVADRARNSWSYRLTRFLRQARRLGPLRTLDQVGYRVYYLLFERRLNGILIRDTFRELLGAALLAKPDVPIYRFQSLNSQEALTTLQSLRPDLVFAVCVNEYLSSAFRRIAPRGTYLYHEGLTPEYMGLHTPFWAIYNGEPEVIGYTLFKVGSRVDAGEPVAQGTGAIAPKMLRYWVWAGHKALLDGLPAVEQALAALERGEEPRVHRVAGHARFYSYVGISDEIRRRVRGAKRAVARKA